jgi:hypothetical protein
MSIVHDLVDIYADSQLDENALLAKNTEISGRKYSTGRL